jgi:hypothetical protein
MGIVGNKSSRKWINLGGGGQDNITEVSFFKVPFFHVQEYTNNREVFYPLNGAGDIFTTTVHPPPDGWNITRKASVQRIEFDYTSIANNSIYVGSGNTGLTTYTVGSISNTFGVLTHFDSNGAPGTQLPTGTFVSPDEVFLGFIGQASVDGQITVEVTNYKATVYLL